MLVVIYGTVMSRRAIRPLAEVMFFVLFMTLQILCGFVWLHKSILERKLRELIAYLFD